MPQPVGADCLPCIARRVAAMGGIRGAPNPIRQLVETQRDCIQGGCSAGAKTAVPGAVMLDVCTLALSARMDARSGTPCGCNDGMSYYVLLFRCRGRTACGMTGEVRVRVLHAEGHRRTFAGWFVDRLSSVGPAEEAPAGRTADRASKSSQGGRDEETTDDVSVGAAGDTRGHAAWSRPGGCSAWANNGAHLRGPGARHRRGRRLGQDRIHQPGHRP
jgi:hypothetical protein